MNKNHILDAISLKNWRSKELPIAGENIKVLAFQLDPVSFKPVYYIPDDSFTIKLTPNPGYLINKERNFILLLDSVTAWMPEEEFYEEYRKKWR